MTAVDPETRPSPPVVDDPGVDRTMARMCPYLAAADGGWRSSTAAREHRCGAVTPPAQLAAEKQRRLCLTADHVTCATYEAARAARPLAQGPAATLPRPLARTIPLVLDHGRIAVAIPALRTDRSTSQALLIVLLAIAFIAILFGRLTGGNDLAGATASTTPRATAAASTGGKSAAPTSRPSATPVASAAASVAPATPRPSAPASRTYKVKSGDTLIGIAAKYGTTPKAIAKLNGISVSANLHVGQVLKIP
ncbi:MAG TPA: LysM peptidoglycan-binding domain-containing protein [Candidatus Limnocylindrales bacterium]